MTCRLVRRHIGVMVDGELDPATQVEFERHVGACVGCRERLEFEQEMRACVREALGGGLKAPEGLRDRVQAALDEADRQATEPEPHRGRVLWLGPMKARHAMPVVAAAAAMLLLFAGPLALGADDGSSGQQAAMGGSPLLDDVVRLHSNALPADVPGERPREVARYFDNKVEFPVRTANFGRGDVRLTGARLTNVRDRRAAALYYQMRDRRVTLVVFEPRTQPLAAPGVLRSRLRGRDLRYQQVRGHVVPVREHRGLTYAMTGDLPRKQLLRLAASLQVQR
ncbi:MAG: anti-sigma factor family protein [Myxococcota bacterium]